MPACRQTGNTGMMEWREEFVLCFLVILDPAIRTLHSAIEAGGDFMLWIMAGPKRGTIKSLKFKVQK